MLCLQAVIVEGILLGDLQILEHYLAQRFGPTKATTINIMNTGLAETIIYLKEKDLSHARDILQHLVGFYSLTKVFL